MIVTTPKNEIINILNLIDQYGVEESLNHIDIESIDDLPIKIILRTIDYSINILKAELNEALNS